MVTSVETRARKGRRTAPQLDVQLLGDVAVRRDGVALALPASRKSRALLGYLALAPRPVTRHALCELLWDVPNDPRGELRWSLSKLRSVLDEDGRARVIADRDSVALDLGDCLVDAIAVRDALQSGIETLDTPQLRALAARFAGEFLESVEIERQPLFSSWLVAQRRRFRACQTAVLERLVRLAPEDSDAVFDDLDQWLQLAPLDAPAHAAMLNALARHGRIREGEQHLETAIRLFDTEGLDSALLKNAWRDARRPHPGTDRDASRSRVIVADPLPTLDLAPTAASRRASIAVMPFVDRTGVSDARGGLAEGLAHDIITRLAKLRVMFVIAHGSVFALGERNIGPEEAGRMLNVDYVASGSVQRRGDRLAIASELVETRSARIVWTDTFEYHAADALIALDDIGDNIVAAIAEEIEVTERNRAILRPPSSLDAWEAYHRGLWHMYRFNRTGQRPRDAVPANVDSPRPDVLARLCGAFVHAFPERVPAPNRGSSSGNRSCVRRRGPEHHRRRSRPGLALGDGSRAVAARRRTTMRSWNSNGL